MGQRNVNCDIDILYAEHDHFQENHCTENKDSIAREWKSVLKNSVMNEWRPMSEGFLKDILRILLSTAQSYIWSFLYIVAEKAKLDLLCEEDIGEALSAHIAKFSDIGAAANSFLKSLRTLTSVVARVAASLECKRDLFIEQKKFSLMFTTKDRSIQ